MHRTSMSDTRLTRWSIDPQKPKSSSPCSPVAVSIQRSPATGTSLSKTRAKSVGRQTASSRAGQSLASRCVRRCRSVRNRILGGRDCRATAESFVRPIARLSNPAVGGGRCSRCPASRFWKLCDGRYTRMYSRPAVERHCCLEVRIRSTASKFIFVVAWR